MALYACYTGKKKENKLRRPLAVGGGEGRVGEEATLYRLFGSGLYWMRADSVSNTVRGLPETQMFPLFFSSRGLLKGQSREMFDPVFYKSIPFLPLVIQAKTVSQTAAIL